MSAAPKVCCQCFPVPLCLSVVYCLQRVWYWLCDLILRCPLHDTLSATEFCNVERLICNGHDGSDSKLSLHNLFFRHSSRLIMVFFDAFRTTVSVHWWMAERLWGMNYRVYGRKLSRIILRYYLSTCLEELKKTAQVLNQASSSDTYTLNHDLRNLSEFRLKRLRKAKNT
jgi:hypothetical protein